MLLMLLINTGGYTWGCLKENRVCIRNRHDEISLLHGKLSSPLSSGSLVLLSISLVEVGNLGDERIIRVGISEQRADGKQDLGQGEGRRPLVF